MDLPLAFHIILLFPFTLSFLWLGLFWPEWMDTSVHDLLVDEPEEREDLGWLLDS